MKASFYGEAKGNRGMVAVKVDHPLAPKQYWTVEEARDHLARLSRALADAEGIERSLSPSRGKA